MYVNELSIAGSKSTIKFEDEKPFKIDQNIVDTDPGRALCVYDLKSHKYVRFLLNSVTNIKTTESK